MTEPNLSHINKKNHSLEQFIELHRLILDNTSDIMVICKLSDLSCEYVNPATTELLGYTLEESISRNPLELIHPDDTERVLQSLKQRLPEGKGSADFRCLRKDGTYIWLGVKGSILNQDQENPSIFIIAHSLTDPKHPDKWQNQISSEGSKNSVLQNATELMAAKRQLEHLLNEQLQTQSALRESENHYRAIFENAGIPTMIVNKDLQVTAANLKSIQLTGYNLEEIIGCNPFEKFVTPAFRDTVRQNYSMRRCAPDEVPWEYEIEGQDKHGNVRNLILNVAAIAETENLVVSIRDISDRKHSEELAISAHQQMEQIIELLPDATTVIDQNGLIVFWNKALEEMTGITKEQMIGRGNYEYAIPFYGERRPVLIDLALIPASHFGDIRGKYDFIHQKGDTLFGEIYVPQFNQHQGAYLWGAASKLVDRNGHIIGAIQSVRDITEHKAAEKARDEAAAIQKMTLLSIGDGIISTDNHGKICLFNPVAEQLTGWSRDEASGKPIEEVFDIRNEFTLDKCISPFVLVVEAGKTIENTSDIVLISKDGQKQPIEHTAAPINDETGNMTGVVLVFRDITDKKERHAKIEFLSYHDHLTELYNRRFFEEELKRLDIIENLPISLIMADVNGLKLANDAFGHSVGDELIKKVVEVMQRECRSGDVLARIGGDEFIFLLPLTASTEAEKIVKRLNASLAQENVSSIILSVAFGWATKEDISEEISTVYKKAEDYMYRRKLSQSSSMESKTIKLIMSTLYEKNPREERHSHRVSELCAIIGKEMGLDTEDLDELRTGGLLHDIGKITLDEHILDKPGALTDSEWFAVRRHSETGYRILSSVNMFSQLANHILAHHERWDGNGYPNGLKGAEIPLQARIIAIADAYDAMTGHRPYRQALDKDLVVREFKRNAGHQFDPYIAKTFVEKVLGMQW